MHISLLDWSLVWHLPCEWNYFWPCYQLHSWNKFSFKRIHILLNRVMRQSVSESASTGYPAHGFTWHLQCLFDIVWSAETTFQSIMREREKVYRQLCLCLYQWLVSESVRTQSKWYILSKPLHDKNSASVAFLIPISKCLFLISSKSIRQSQAVSSSTIIRPYSDEQWAEKIHQE